MSSVHTSGGFDVVPATRVNEYEAIIEPREEVSLVRFVTFLLRRRYAILVTVALGFAIGFALSFGRQRMWTSASAFVPQSRRASSSALSGLAAQFGIAVPTGEGAQSPAFYLELVNSRSIVKQLSETPFEIPDSTGRLRRGTVVDFEFPEGKNDPVRRDVFLAGLTKRIVPELSPRTGVISVRVTGSSPQLALAMNRRLLELVNTFNLSTRQSQATAERRFTERRRSEVQSDLRAAERRLLEFARGNRTFTEFSALRIDEDRLRRDVQSLQQLYNSLNEAYEQARIEEVRDTPVITVLESPELPIRRNSRNVVLTSLGGAVVGLVLGLLIAFLREYFERARERGDAREYAALREARRQALADLRNPLRAVRRLSGARG